MPAPTDGNQAMIVRALLRAKATVQSLHTVGDGCPDLLVGYEGKNWLMYVKTSTDNVNQYQEHWHALWAGQVAVVRDHSEAVNVILGMPPKQPTPGEVAIINPDPLKPRLARPRTPKP